MNIYRKKCVGEQWRGMSVAFLVLLFMAGLGFADDGGSAPTEVMESVMEPKVAPLSQLLDDLESSESPGLAVDESRVTAVPQTGGAQIETLTRLLYELESRADRLQDALDRSEAQRREDALVRAGTAMREQLQVTDAPGMAWSLNDVGLLMMAEGRLAEARVLFERALAILSRHFDEAHPARGTVLQSLGEVLLGLGESELAAGRFREAAMVFGTAAGTGNPRLAAVLNAWATALGRLGRAEEADALYRRAIRIYEAEGKKRPSDLAAPLHNLGLLLLSQGKTEESGRLLENSLEVLKKNRQGDSFAALTVLRALVRQRLAAGLSEDAARFEEQAGILAIKHMERATDAK